MDSPVYGVIFLFKYPTGEASQSIDTPQDGAFDFDAAENLFFAAQTIQNACGTQALLSVLLNQETEVEIGPKLKEFKDFTGAFSSDVRRPYHLRARGLLYWLLILGDAAAGRGTLELGTYPRRT